MFIINKVKMSQEMREVIKGVVKDHRLVFYFFYLIFCVTDMKQPSDYGSHFVQPLHTKSFLTVFKRYLLEKLIKSMHAALPLQMLFVNSISFSNSLTDNLSSILWNPGHIQVLSNRYSSLNIPTKGLALQKGQICSPALGQL